jgi:hypothetical protein
VVSLVKGGWGFGEMGLEVGVEGCVWWEEWIGCVNGWGGGGIWSIVLGGNERRAALN